MPHNKILKNLADKQYKPIYLLSGEEAYYIDKISDFIAENVLDEGEKAFNHHILYGKDIDVDYLLGTAKQFPMMSEYLVVIVKEAQNLKGIEKLASYAENPLTSTILVLCHKHKKINKRTKEAKALVAAAKKQGEFLETEKVREWKITDWILNYVTVKGYVINPQTAQLVGNFLGNDLSKITNEIDKLIINIGERKNITADDIEKNIGISKDFNVFELQKALGTKDVLKANQIIKYFEANPKSNPLVMSISAIFNQFSKVLQYHMLPNKGQAASVLKVPPFFVKDYEVAARNYPQAKVHKIISDLHTFDMKSKGVNQGSATHGELLKELVYKVLH